MIILGIDPGLAIVGWGVIESVRGNVRPVAYGAITTPAHTDIEARLLMIQNDLEELIKKYSPDEMAIEELFFNTNITTAIGVAEARGVILLAAQKNNIPVQVKTAVTGGNNSGAIHLTKSGVRTITLSLPGRYIHSSATVGSKNDVIAQNNLAVALLNELAGGNFS